MDLELVKNIINNGELAIIPTDTVYGIIADATNTKAIKKVYEVKKRDLSKPLIILVSNMDMLKEYVKELNDLEKEVMDKYFPGALTIILKKNDKVSDLLTAGNDTIGIRIPDNKELCRLIDLIHKPIIATSANISNNETITNVGEIDKVLRRQVKYIYDGGVITNVASTIIRIDNNKIIFLRDGDLSRKIKEDFKDKI